MAKQATAVDAAASPLIVGIDRSIELIEQQAHALQEGAPPAAQRGGAGAPAIQPGQTLEDLTMLLARLKQIRDWFQQDQRLLPIVDEYIGKQVKASEQRTNAHNTRLAVITTLVGAILGWLISAVSSTPVELLSRFTGH